MPNLVYRITEVLSALVLSLPIGTNLGLFQVLWTLISGRLLQTRGALIPALAATGLAPTQVRRAWAAFAEGAWTVTRLIATLESLVQREGRWQACRCGRYRVVAVDTVGFFRPRLKGCATKHFLSQAGCQHRLRKSGNHRVKLSPDHRAKCPSGFFNVWPSAVWPVLVLHS